LVLRLQQNRAADLVLPNEAAVCLQVAGRDYERNRHARATRHGELGEVGRHLHAVPAGWIEEDEQDALTPVLRERDALPCETRQFEVGSGRVPGEPDRCGRCGGCGLIQGIEARELLLDRFETKQDAPVLAYE